MPKEPRSQWSSIIDEVVGNEDLAFHISSYLCPNRNPSRLLNLCLNLIFVSRSWNESFSLVRAQLRWDFLTKHVRDDEENEWLYHKLCYLPCTSTADNETGRTIPREGCLRIFRSHCNKTCDDATKAYQADVQNDHYSGVNRTDSRPDYYYRAHRETPEFIDFVLPRPLPYNSTIQFVNEIEYDDRPRLVNKFTTSILGDCIGVQSPMAQGRTSKEGQWDLGYHEIVSVRDMRTAKCHPRPPLNNPGEDTSSFLHTCKAKPSDDPRWIKLCHLIGEDGCRNFLKRHVLPMMGPRPNANAWNSSEMMFFDHYHLG